MKTKTVAWLLVLSTLALTANGQTAASSGGAEDAVADRGASWRTWQKTDHLTNQLTGAIIDNVAKYTELGDGLCYQDQNGQWLDYQDLIEITPTGAAAVHGQTKAYFRPNLNTVGAVTLTTASGQVFATRPLGLYYFDTASGKTALISPIQNSTGTLVPPNQVVYANAFAGLGDVSYVWAHNGFEQNVVLLNAPPPPDALAFGMNPATTRLEIWTEFVNPPPLNAQRPVILKQETNPTVRQTMVEPDLVDHLLLFNDLFFPVGAAFLSDNSHGAAPNEAVPVRIPSRSDPKNVFCAKSWRQLGDRAILVESTPYPDLLPMFKVLKQAALPAKPAPPEQLAQESVLVPPPSGQQGDQPLTIAQAPYTPKGLILDYTTISGSQYSWTFYTGTTYLIAPNGSFTIGPGTATFQNNSYIKYGPNAQMTVYGAVAFPQYNTDPVVFTSVDDNSVGEPIGSGHPTYAASKELDLYYNPTPVTVNNGDFRDAQLAIELDENPYAPTCSIDNSIFEESTISLSIYADGTTIALPYDTECRAPSIVNNSWESGTTVSGSLSPSCTTAPIAAFTPPSASGLGPLTVQFTDTSTAGPYVITSWAWDFGDGSTSTAQNPPAHTYPNAGTYTTRLTVTADNGLPSLPASATIQVVNPVTASFTWTPTTGQDPLTVHFTDQSTVLYPQTISEWQWTFGDGSTYTAYTDATRNPPSDILYHFGTYSVTLTVTASGGPTSTKRATIYVSPTTIANVSHMAYHEGEPTIAVNPIYPSRVVVFAQRPYGSLTSQGLGIMKSLSTDGGSTWTDSSIIATGSDYLSDGVHHLPQSGGGDVCAVYDKFGTLYLSYLTHCCDGQPMGVAVLYSSDDGATWSQVGGNTGSNTFTTQFSGGVVDQPWLATGPSGTSAPYSLWICYVDGWTDYSTGFPTPHKYIKVSGAAISNLGSVGAFAAPQTISTTDGIFYDGQRIAVSPSGQIMCIFQDGQTGIYFSVNQGGLATPSSFSAATLLRQNASVKWNYHIPAEPTRNIDIGASVAFDCYQNSSHKGRAYVVYTDAPSAAPYDTDIYILRGDYNSSSGMWSWTVAKGNGAGNKINDESNGTSQFWPAIAVDQGTGNLAVSWYDCRNDPNNENVQVQYFGAVSTDGGDTFSPNLQLTPGHSDATRLNWTYTVNGVPTTESAVDFPDYTALAYAGGYVYAVWSDNSNMPAVPNADNGTTPSEYLDTYMSKFAW
ncbi:MAG: PKD domain-containing protein [Limisphaerales bacterium]